MLVIDDGSFEVGNSFITLVNANDYHIVRATAGWLDAMDDDKEAALVRAFDYLRTREWLPGTFDEGIPQRIRDSQAVGAYRELVSPGVLLADVEPGLKRKRIEGAIETEYFEGKERVVMVEIERLIKPYVVGHGITRTLVRA